MKNTEMLYEALRLNANEQVEQLIKGFLRSNEQQTGSKFNIFDYASKKDTYRPVFTGVYYKDGYLYATNGLIAVKVKQEYRSELEGKIIDKNGLKINGIFPNVNNVIPAEENLTYHNVDFKRIIEVSRIAEIDRKADKKSKSPDKLRLINVGGVFFEVFMLSKLAKFAINFNIQSIGVNREIQCSKISDGINTALIMPVGRNENNEYQIDYTKHY